MICPFCKEEVSDGAIKCKHCGSQIEGTVVGSAISNQEIMDKIEKSSNSESIKNKFKTFATNNATVGFFGPSFAPKIGFPAYANWWAFFFNCWYYIFTGMWKKGLSLAGIGLIVWSIGVAINSVAITQLGTLFIAIIALLSANYDRYRKEILGENFWW